MLKGFLVHECIDKSIKAMSGFSVDRGIRAKISAVKVPLETQKHEREPFYSKKVVQV